MNRLGRSLGPSGGISRRLARQPQRAKPSTASSEGKNRIQQCNRSDHNSHQPACPQWVINGPDGPEIRRPLYPRKRTQVGHRAMSEKCHKRTHAPQQSAPYSITRSAVATRPSGTRASSNLAAFRLIARSKTVGSSTGNSLVLAPPLSNLSM